MVWDGLTFEVTVCFHFSSSSLSLYTCKSISLQAGLNYLLQSQTFYSKPYPFYPCYKCEWYAGNLSSALESNKVSSCKTLSKPCSYKHFSSCHEEPVCRAVVVWKQTHSKSYSPKYLSSGPCPDREGLNRGISFKRGIPLFELKTKRYHYWS